MLPLARKVADAGAGREIRLVYAGLFLLLALLLGGGTERGLISDFILQLLALPFLRFFVRNFPRGLSRAQAGLIVLIFAVFAWQLLPVPGADGWRFPNTLTPGETLQMLLWLLVPLAFFYRVLLMDARQQAWLGWWFLAGVAANFLLSVLQFSSAVFSDHFQPFEWKMKAGFFANENHLAMLFVIAVPVLMALLKQAGRGVVAVPVIMLMLLYQAIVRSQAGVGFILLAAVLSLLLLHAQGRVQLMMGALLAMVVVAVAWLLFPTLLTQLMAGGTLSRWTFWQNTWAAVLQHMPFGSGFGSFITIYAKHENPAEVVAKYVNHAHNDWLELVLEGGVAALVLLAAFMLLLIVRLFRRGLDDMQRVALLALVFLLLHSLIDYPLRTYTLAVTCAWLLAMFMGRREETHEFSMEA